MVLQFTKTEFSSSAVTTINGLNQMEVGPKLDNLLQTEATSVTYVSSYYTCHDKGDVMAGVVYGNGGTQNLRSKEFFDARSFYGTSAFSVAGAYTGVYGEPIASNSSNSFINRINRWLEDRQLGNNATIAIKRMHFVIDDTGQKRVFLVYDNANTTSTRYYAKIYSQKSVSVGQSPGDGPAEAFDQDLQYIENRVILPNSLFVDAAVDPSGNRHILAIYAVTI